MSGKGPEGKPWDTHALVASLGKMPEQEAGKIAEREGARHLLSDLIAAAREGATRAAARYKIVDGATFADFAKCHVRGGCYDFLRHEARQRAYKRAAEMAAHLGYAQVTPSRDDHVDARRDDEPACRQKLSGYVNAKLSAITVAFWMEVERSAPDAQAAAEMRPFMDSIREDFAAFRQTDQVLMRAIYAGGTGIKEAAAAAGIAEPTAKVRHRKLLDRLREGFRRRGLGAL